MSYNHHKPEFETVIEDTVQCLFFFTSLWDSDVTFWEQRCIEINTAIEKLSENYIWHRDEFKLFLPIDNNTAGVPLHLASSTCFGDNVEDEWFIVYIVLQLSKHYEDLIVQMRDNDGEFLLIEAADLLPSWANPENTENRVFISNNHIHIIQPNILSTEKKMDLLEALQFVCNKQTYVSSDIDEAIMSRIGSYPEKAQSNMHNAIVRLPIHIAALLNLKPALIAPLVCAYSSCDAIDAKACKNIIFDECVTAQVKFTKFLYAMLIHSKLLNCVSKYKFDSEKDKQNVIGLKLTCGFQIIMNSCTDIFSTKEYRKFLGSLKENGYFKDNIEGSKDYKELLEKAQSFFSNIECPMNQHVFNQISKIMTTKEHTNVMETLKLQQSSDAELFEDSDDWLNVQAEQLNDFLEMNYGKKTKFKSNDNITPEVITSELTKFLTKSSDFEGIETTNDEDKHINFDPDEFANCLEKIMNLLTNKTDNSDYDSELSDMDETKEDMDSLEGIEENEMDEELKQKLHIHNEDDLCTDDLISRNLLQSIKEEHASSGPSSNLLNTIGIKKQDILDSDDDND